MHLSGLTPGDKISLEPNKVSRDEMIEFAREFDQAPFHLDEEAAKNTMLGGLCASGWQTCALTLRMMHDACFKNFSYLGAESMEDCKWIRPLYMDEEISGTATLIDIQPLNDTVLVTFSYEITNQDKVPILSMKHTAVLASEEASNG